MRKPSSKSFQVWCGRVAVMFFAGVVFTSCGVDQYGFNPVVLPQIEPSPLPSGPVPSPTPSCSVGSTQKKLRIFVMVDNSGSTEETDPNQDYRVETMNRFLAQYGLRTNLTYGFGYFADSAYVYDTNEARFRTSSANAPFGNARQTENALSIYHRSIPPEGGTGYGAAFDAIRGAIAKDQASGVAQDYVVIFMSDGQPTDLYGDIPAQIRSQVDSLKRTAQAGGRSLTVSSVYFGPRSDSTSIRNLKTMATQGAGQFVDTNSLGSGGLVIDDLITIPGC